MFNFVPDSPATNKRRRNPDSPDNIIENTKHPKMVDGKPATLQEIANLLDLKLKDLPTKENFLELSAKIDKLQDENSKLRENVKQLISREKQLCNKVESLEIDARSCNLVFKGIPVTPNFNAHDEITNLCKTTLGINASICYVRKLRSTGNAEKASFVVTFGSRYEAISVLKSKKSLNVTGIKIQKDLPVSARKKTALMYSLKKEIIKQNADAKIFVADNYFVFENNRYYIADNKIYNNSEEITNQLTVKFGFNVESYLINFQNNSNKMQNKSNVELHSDKNDL